MPTLTLNDLLTAFALILILEGVAMAAFPAALRRALETLDALPREALRWTGLLVALFGLFLLYLTG